MAIASLPRFAAFAAAAVLSVHCSLVEAQKCDRRGVVSSATDVYERVPQFVTGRGWVGNRIASLRQSTQVYVCTEQNADFGLSTKVWLQIAFKTSKSGKEVWAYGWVLKEAMTTGQAAPGYRFAFIAVALADESSPSNPPDQKKPEWSLGAPPPAPSLTDTGAPAKGEGPATLSDLTVLYGPLFIGMLLGMMAKTAVDCLDAPSKKGILIEHLRNGSIAILVSPIVFLGFLQAGEFGASTQAFVVLWLLAFQNGFFWQTVLKRNAAGEKKGS